MRSFTNIAALPVIGVALLLGEAGITGLSSFRPRVDEYYYSYYISGQRSCWLPRDVARQAAAGLRVNDIHVAQLDQARACFLLARGWSTLENWGVWSDGRVAALDLPVVTGKRQVTLNLIGFSTRNNQHVTIYVNEILLGSFLIPSSKPTALPIKLPAGATENLHIALYVAHPFSPSFFNNNPDRRRLGVGLIAISWQ